MQARIAGIVLVLLLSGPVAAWAQQPAEEPFGAFATQLIETIQSVDPDPDRVYYLDVRATNSVSASNERVDRIRQVARAAGAEAMDLVTTMRCPEQSQHPNDCYFPDHASVVAIRLETPEISGDSAKVPYRFYVQDRLRPAGIFMLHRWAGFTRQDGQWLLTEYNPITAHERR